MRSFGLARQWKLRQLFSVKGKEGHRGGLIIKLISARFDHTSGNVTLLQAHFEEHGLVSSLWSKQTDDLIKLVLRDKWEHERKINCTAAPCILCVATVVFRAPYLLKYVPSFCMFWYIKPPTPQNHSCCCTRRGEVNAGKMHTWNESDQTQ